MLRSLLVNNRLSAAASDSTWKQVIIR